jgi:hypothetical protein
LLMYDDGNVVLQWFSADYRIRDHERSRLLHSWYRQPDS